MNTSRGVKRKAPVEWKSRGASCCHVVVAVTAALAVVIVVTARAWSDDDCSSFALRRRSGVGLAFEFFGKSNHIPFGYPQLLYRYIHFRNLQICLCQYLPPKITAMCIS